MPSNILRIMKKINWFPSCLNSVWIPVNLNQNVKHNLRIMLAMRKSKILIWSSKDHLLRFSFWHSILPRIQNCKIPWPILSTNATPKERNSLKISQKSLSWKHPMILIMDFPHWSMTSKIWLVTVNNGYKLSNQVFMMKKPKKH